MMYSSSASGNAGHSQPIMRGGARSNGGPTLTGADFMREASEADQRRFAQLGFDAAAQARLLTDPRSAAHVQNSPSVQNMRS